MSEERKRTALVTGGAGFIGSHLIDCLRTNGYRVVAVDNLFRGRVSNLTHRSNDADTMLVIGDVRDSSAMRQLFEDFRPHAVFHLAAIAFIPYNIAHPAESLTVNVVGTQVLLEAAQAYPPAVFVFASTADVYVPQPGPNREDQSTAPYNIYGITKGFGERLLALAAEANGACRFVATRFFNVYGTRETNPHVIPELVEQALRGDGTVRAGNLWPCRDYVFVEDVAHALVRIAEHPHDHAYEVFNIGTGVEHSVQDIITLLGRLLKRKIRPVVEEARTRRVERDHLVADIGKIRRTVNWTPRFTLEDGLRQLLSSLTT